MSTHRILATSSRMFFGLDEIRKFGEGNGTGGEVREVVAVDTFRSAPGSHSSGATHHAVVPAPRQETAAFLAAVSTLVDEYDIDLIMPMFEESVYLAAGRELFDGRAELFAPSVESLATAHNKVTFTQLCERIGLPVAPYRIAESREEFLDAITVWPEWFARRSFGRAGLDIATNIGDLAAETDLAAVDPTPDMPWIVQQALHGKDRCSWSIAHCGRVSLHSTYDHLAEIEGHGSIAFGSVVSPEALDAARRIAAELDWHGQLSLDYFVTDDGTHYMVECNIRPTAGATLATPAEFDAGVFAPGPEPVVVPEGRRRSVKVGLLRDALRHPSHLKADLRVIHSTGDVYAYDGDVLPLLSVVMSLGHTVRYGLTQGDAHKHQKLIASQFYDISWDGSPLTTA